MKLVEKKHRQEMKMARAFSALMQPSLALIGQLNELLYCLWSNSMVKEELPRRLQWRVHTQTP